MLKPKQLSVAKTVVDSLLQAASEENRKSVQVTRWDGTDTTAFLTSTGCIFIGWFGRPSSKMSPDPNWYIVPKDWDKAEVVNNALTADSSDNCWPIGPDKEMANKIISSLLTGSRGKPWSGVSLENFCETHKGYKFVVCHGHTVFFVWKDKAPGKSAVWSNSISELPNSIFAVNDNVNRIMQVMYEMDNESKVLITQHSSGAVLMHIVSEEFRTEVHFVLPYASVFDGREVWLSTTMKTTAIRKAVFDDIINTKNNDNKEEKEMSDAVSMSDLNAIMGGESKKEEKKTAVSKVETTQKEDSLKKPEKEENPPWEPEEAPAKATTEESSEVPKEKPVEVQLEEPVKTVPEQLEDLSLQLEELQSILSDASGRVKFLKGSVKAVAKRYKAESKTIKRSAEDAKKLEDYDRLAAQLAKFKKLLAE